jgi:hypothetical protein
MNSRINCSGFLVIYGDNFGDVVYGAVFLDSVNFTNNFILEYIVSVGLGRGKCNRGRIFNKIIIKYCSFILFFKINRLFKVKFNRGSVIGSV